ncbi:MAG: hypothetical protein AAFV29_15120, partial [Myxococcota bacterium]
AAKQMTTTSNHDRPPTIDWPTVDHRPDIDHRPAITTGNRPSTSRRPSTGNRPSTLYRSVEYTPADQPAFAPRYHRPVSHTT